jgi:hypothetical protein
MANTGERHETTRRVNAKQAETLRQSKKLLSKTRQLSASMQANSVKRRASSAVHSQHPTVFQGARADEEASSRMEDEGCPNENPSRNNAAGFSKEDVEATSAGCNEAL